MEQDVARLNKYPWIRNIDRILKSAVPCPLCGDNGELLRVGNQKEFWIYECIHCGVPVYDSGEASITPMKAVIRWNDYVNSYKRLTKKFKRNDYKLVNPCVDYKDLIDRNDAIDAISEAIAGSPSTIIREIFAIKGCPSAFEVEE